MHISFTASVICETGIVLILFSAFPENILLIGKLLFSSYGFIIRQEGFFCHDVSFVTIILDFPV